MPASKEGVLGTCGLDTVERVEGVCVCVGVGGIGVGGAGSLATNKNEVKKQGAVRGVC